MIDVESIEAEMQAVKVCIKAFIKIGAYDAEGLIAAAIIFAGRQVAGSIDSITADNLHDALQRIGDKLDRIAEQMP